MSIYSEFGRIGHQRGQIAEELVAQALKEPESCPDWVKGYCPATLEDDARGIDGWVDTDVGKIPFQVKSSWAGVRKAQKKHPRIPVFRVSVGESSQATLSKCLEVVEKQRQAILAKRGQ